MGGRCWRLSGEIGDVLPTPDISEPGKMADAVDIEMESVSAKLKALEKEEKLLEKSNKLHAMKLALKGKEQKVKKLRAASEGTMDTHHEDNESVLQEFIKFLKEYFEIEQKKVEVQRFSREHPVVTIFLMVTITMCAVPIVLFGVFVVGSIIFSFLGFLFVEGTVLLIGTIVLGGVLLFAGLLAVGLSGFIVVAYYSIMVFGADVVNSVQDKLSGLKIPALAFLFRNNGREKEEAED